MKAATHSCQGSSPPKGGAFGALDSNRRRRQASRHLVCLFMGRPVRGYSSFWGCFSCLLFSLFSLVSGVGALVGCVGCRASRSSGRRWCLRWWRFRCGSRFCFCVGCSSCVSRVLVVLVVGVVFLGGAPRGCAWRLRRFLRCGRRRSSSSSCLLLLVGVGVPVVLCSASGCGSRGVPGFWARVPRNPSQKEES